jgi:dipeptidyl aminopeptidase/acylaminoacyl peptidase
MIAVFPDCPITGPADQANNTFASQLRNNMHAVIEALAARNLIDRRMLAIGGHSYGGFGTANALIHTPFFRAGIAGAGNYNRTLTPFGFQRESRQLWQSPDVYTDISAILHADNMTGALLMYHGQEDQNMGTFPIHSLRMFDVLESMGKAAALYMYPFEDHGQRGLETRLDMWARWTAWLEKHARVSE